MSLVRFDAFAGDEEEASVFDAGCEDAHFSYSTSCDDGKVVDAFGFLMRCSCGSVNFVAGVDCL